MTAGARPPRFVPQPLRLGRSVRIPSDREARTALARDLSRDAQGLVDEHKASGLMWLPLMDVALEGYGGFVAEVRKAA